MKEQKSPTVKNTRTNNITDITTGKDKQHGLSFSKLALIILLILLYTGIGCGAVVTAANVNVITSTAGRIDPDTVGTDYDCIIVLGAGVRADGRMSDMLRDRMDTGIRLYREGVAPRILVTGDHGREEYDEVNTMKAYAIECGVAPSDVFMDHAGFSTYESMYRASEIFGVRRAVVVTQRYHLYRALYIADYLGIEARGISADLHSYGGQMYREIREVLARVNDSVKRYTRPAPTYLGESIPISGDGNITNDK